MRTTKIHTWLRQRGPAFLLSLVFLWGLTACREDLTEGEQAPGGRAIRITASLPDDAALSKAASPKESFAKGDVIHVYAEFTLAGSVGGSGRSTAYGCMVFDGAGTWSASDGTTLEWPWNATAATFKAYYIPPVTVGGTVIKNNTALNPTAGSNALGFSLSDLTAAAVETGADPMVATYTDIPAESAVHLQFNHIFTKLTFTHLGKETNYSGSVTDGELLYLSAPDLKDSCIFQREADGDKLSDAFEPGKGYVGSRAESAGSDGSYTVTYLLPPVAAPGIDLRLHFKDFSPYHLVPVKQALQAGRHYSLDITKLADNYWADDLKEQEWNKNEAAVTLSAADINAYLAAIRDGMEFRKDGKQVLDVYTETTGGKTTTVVTQLRDVDFNAQSFTPVSISTNIIFQGNAHTIRNLYVQQAIDENGAVGSEYEALFGKNEGTIRNLRIEGAKAARLSARHVGTLVAFNLGTGTIENVRIVFHSGDQVLGSQAAEFVGGLVGVNEGTVTGCTLRGSGFSVQGLTAASGRTCYIGGMIGYNSGASSTVHEARIQAENAFVSSTGASGYVHIGGWAGYSDSRKVEASASSLGVRAEASEQVHAGGFAGSLYGALEKCSATGAVELTPGSSVCDAGGFAGVAVNVTLKACYAAGRVSSTAAGAVAGASVGGFAGRLAFEGTGASDVLNCFAIGKLPAASDGGFVASAAEVNDPALTDATKVVIRNCFSRNNADVFIGNAGATLTNIHQNGKVGGSAVTVSDLNNARPADGFEWVDRPALYGDGFPYFIIN